MLEAEDIINFFNKLEFAGLKPPGYSQEYKQAMLYDFAERYSSRTTSRELRLAADLLQTSSIWPTYREIDETLSCLRGTEEELGQTELAQDQYPDGEKWEDIAIAFGRKHFKELDEAVLTDNLLPLYWLLQTQECCRQCNGASCQYYGHRPYLRKSNNGKALYECVETKLCSRYNCPNELEAAK